MSARKIRHDIELDPDVALEISRREEESKRPRYPSEEGRAKATWSLAPDLVRRIRELAAELRVPQYLLAEKLLRHSLDQYDQGELELRVKPVIERYTLE